VLWQPSLPDEYVRATPEELASRIKARRAELGSRLVILGHHYQTDDVIQHADFTGDSLKLSQLAAKKVTESGAEFVIFCGVHFMAETADMLTPEHVQVILPDLSAGCSMADMADYDDAMAAWETLHHTLREQDWHGRIVPITYINSTAAIKAFVGKHGGAVCTSSNARLLLERGMHGPWIDEATLSSIRDRDAKLRAHAGNGHKEHSTAREIKLLFLPDQHLGRNTAASFGLDVDVDTAVYDPRKTAKGQPLGGMSVEELVRAKVLLWAGHCSVHKLFRPEHCDEIREANRHLPENERTMILVHPECCKPVVDRSDLAGSTEFIIKTIRESATGSRWAVGTEVHLVTRLAREAAAREGGGVQVRILSDCQCLCTTMYRIDQEHLCWVLDNLSRGKVVNRITVHAEARRLALAAVQRMLDLSPAAGTKGASGVNFAGQAKAAREQAMLVD
jgi:quinolinate synthase